MPIKYAKEYQHTSISITKDCPKLPQSWMLKPKACSHSSNHAVFSMSTPLVTYWVFLSDQWSFPTCILPKYTWFPNRPPIPNVHTFLSKSCANCSHDLLLACIYLLLAPAWLNNSFFNPFIPPTICKTICKTWMELGVILLKEISQAQKDL
jgi:hypothetical protein